MADLPISFLPKVRSEALMGAIEGMPCAARVCSLIGHPCSPRSTVVGAHIPGVYGKGMSTKVSDLCVLAACARCHAIIDRVDTQAWRTVSDLYPAAFAHRLLAGLAETHGRLLAKGIITVKGGELI